MSRRVWMIRRVVGLLAWISIGFGVAEAAVILPVDANKVPISGSPVTVSIFQGGVDVTGSWLPESGQTVQIVVNGLTSPSISLVSPVAANPITAGTLTTSAYLGICTNFGSDTGPDFTVLGDQLTSNDCGGMAVIGVTGGGSTYTFVLPQDTDFDGLPDIWEAKHCTATSVTCLTPAADGEAGTETGDGFRTHDEYRGFIVSPDDATPGFIFAANGITRKHIRTSPLVKDIFIHPVKGQCAAPGAASVLDSYPAPITPNASVTPSATSGTGVTFTANTAVFRTSQIGGLIINLAGTGKARITGISGTSDPTVLATVVTADIIEPFPSTAPLSSPNWQIRESVFATFYTLFPPSQIHILGSTSGPNSDQWVDTFVSLSIGSKFLVDGVTPNPNANVASFEFAPDPNNQDRQVNQNSAVGSPKQKGARLIECLDNQFADPVGFSSWAPLTTGFDNAVVFTRRIANATTPLGFIDSKIAAGGNRKLVVQIKKCVKDAANKTCPWVTIYSGAGAPNDQDTGFVKTKYVQYIVGMELGHSIKVNPSLGTYGPHDSPDSGDILGANAQIVVSNSPTGTNTFQIPALFLKATNRDFKLH